MRKHFGLIAGSALALAALCPLTAAASVIYTDLSSAPPVADNTSANAGVVYYSLDGLGNEIWFSHISTDNGHGTLTSAEAAIQVSASGGRNEGVYAVDDGSHAYIVPLAADANIGGSLSYYGGPGELALYSPPTGVTTPKGDWANGTGALTNTSAGYRGYMGFAVQLSDSFTHYGWADVAVRPLSTTDMQSYAITIYGFAYESVADIPIRAGQTTDSAVPEPSSLLLMAVGVVAAGRKRWLAAKPA